MDPVKQKKRLTILFVLLPIDMAFAVMLQLINSTAVYEEKYNDVLRIIVLLDIVMMCILTAVACVLTYKQLKIEPEKRVKASEKFWIPILIIAFGYIPVCLYSLYSLYK
jgi:amino acid transporter